MRQGLADNLRSRSTPLLHHDLPDLRSRHNFNQARNPAPLSNRKPIDSTPRAARLRARLPYRRFDSLDVDGRAVELFNAAIEEVKTRPRRASHHSAIVLQALESLTTQLDIMPLSVSSFQKKRNLYACCLNYLLPKLSMHDQSGKLLAFLFRRYDEAAMSLTSLIGVESIRASDCRDQEILKLRSRVKQLEQSLSASERKFETTLEDLKHAEEAKNKSELELELYRKYVFVKTGKRSLDWGMIIPDGKLPTIEYMRAAHPARAALIEAQLEAARRAKELEYVKPEDLDDDQAREVSLQLQKSAINDVCDDLDSIAKRIAELWIVPTKGDFTDTPV